MSQSETTMHSTLAQSDSEFVSEDVYAHTTDMFTRVTCGDVYAFSSIATSNDYSESADSMQTLLQIGVEITFPNGRTELIALQPENLLHYPQSARETLLEQLFNEGEIWIAQYDSIFKPSIFPKTWDTMLVPDVTAIDDVLSYRDSKLLGSYSPDGRAQIIEIFGMMGVSFSTLIGVSALTFMLTSSLLGSGILGLGAMYLLLKNDEVLLQYVNRNFDASVLWGQQMDTDEIPIEPIDAEFKKRLETVLCGLRDTWTTATVLSAEEGTEQTTLRLLTSVGAEITVTCPTPADKSDRFVLNQLVSAKSVGSVQQLEGEQIQIGLSGLGKESDVVEGSFRLRG